VGKPGQEAGTVNGVPRSIGTVSRESGLSLSALRFYDRAGILRPARVDPVTGYRWYTADQVAQARLIAALRQASMPLTAIRDVLAARHDPAVAGRLLDQQVTRLEDGLANARRHLTAARALLDRPHQPTTSLTVLGADLRSALATVRFAVSYDAGLPALSGVLFDYRGGTLRLVASDRYRLAVATVPVSNQDGPDARVIAPLSLVDQGVLAPTHQGTVAGQEVPAASTEVPIRLGPGTVVIGTARAVAVDADFPDYEQHLQKMPGRQVAVSTADLLHRLATGSVLTVAQPPGSVPHEVSVMKLAGGSVEVLDRAQPGAAGFNRGFLVEALGAGGADQLVLALDGPAAPLVITDPAQPGGVSLLMPTLLAVSSG
jgi:DNA polymerase-3 subunit beta